MHDVLLKPPLYFNERIDPAYRRVLIEVPGSRQAIVDYLAQTGEEVDELDTFATALKLVCESELFKQKLKAYEIRAWTMFNNIAYVGEYLELINSISHSMYCELLIKKLYINNKLPYLCEQVFGNRLLLCSKDVYVNRILDELRRQ